LDQKSIEVKSIMVPSGKYGVVTRTSNSTPLLLDPGRHQINDLKAFILIDSSPVVVPVTALCRSRDPSKSDLRYHYRLVVELDKKSIASNATTYGPSFFEVIATALAQSIADDLNADIIKERLHEEAFRSTFQQRLANESAEHGLTLLEIRDEVSHEASIG
jgi:hypothetical protein